MRGGRENERRFVLSPRRDGRSALGSFLPLRLTSSTDRLRLETEGEAAQSKTDIRSEKCHVRFVQSHVFLSRNDQRTSQRIKNRVKNELTSADFASFFARLSRCRSDSARVARSSASVACSAIESALYHHDDQRHPINERRAIHLDSCSFEMSLSR